jgi:HlyD family secretion protein
MPLTSLAPESRRTLLLIAVLLPLLAVFGYVALNSGPLAPVPVVLGKVEKQPLTPALFGTGNVVARATHKVGPTSAGRLSRVAVQTGDKVRAGQWLAEVEPVDLDQRVAAQQAALQRADAGIVAARAQRDEAQVRQEFAARQAQRYAQLQTSGFASPELTLAKRQEWQAAQAGLRAAQAALASAEQERQRLQAEREASRRQRDNLTLRAPVDGWVVRRNADPGTTLLAGQAVLEPPLGELAEVTVNLPALPPAPVLPDAAVHREGDVPGVWFLTADGIRFQPVTLGAADLDGRVQVLAGSEGR